MFGGCFDRKLRDYYAISAANMRDKRLLRLLKTKKNSARDAESLPLQYVFTLFFHAAM